MNASDNNYKTLFLMFLRVLNFCEGNNDDEDVEMMFKSAKILEDSCRELENIGATESFETKLKEFWELKGLKCVPLQFFKKASHHLLSRYMVDSKFSDSVVNMAVVQFIRNRSERDFHEFAQQLTNTNRTVETLRKTLYSPENMDKYKAEHCLEELRKSLISSSGDVEEIYSEISKAISNDPSIFKIFLGILCLHSDSGVTQDIQEVVALSLSNLLRDCSNINVYPHLFNLSAQDFDSIVTKWHYLIEAILQTVRESVKRLQCDYSGNSYTWTNTGTDPCLSFDQIVTLFSMCRNLPGIKDSIKDFLQQIGEEGFGILAEDIVIKCQIR